MANPQFSSQVVYPITEKPQTDPKEVAVYRDLFNVFNSFRILFGQLDQEFAKKLNDAPSDGKTYGRQDGDWVEVTGGGGGSGGGGALEFVKEVVVSVATADIVFSGLDADADEMYQLELIHKIHAPTNNNNIHLYLNTDFTDSNYIRSTLQMESGVIYTSGSSAPVIGVASYGTNNDVRFFTTQLKKIAGAAPIYTTFGSGLLSASTQGQRIVTIKRLNTENITSFTLRNSLNFGVGTRARLYRLRKDNGSGGGGNLPAYMDPKTGQYWLENFTRGLGASSTGSTFDNAQTQTTYLFNGGTRSTYSDQTSAGVNLITGTNASGGARHFFGAPSIRIGGGEIRFKAVVTLNQAMTATQDGGFSIGLMDVISGTVTGRVDARFSFAANAYRWQLVSYAAGVATTVNTTIAAPAAGVKTSVELVINAAGTQTDLYIDGVLAGSVATSISILLSPAVQFNKSAGTTSTSGTLHYAEFKKVYTTPLP